MQKTAPLVISPIDPETNSSPEELSTFVKNNQGCIQDALMIYGAVLFRGFATDADVDDAVKVQNFEDVISSLDFDPSPFFGTSPRVMFGQKYIFRS